MRGNGKGKGKQILKKMFITPKEDIFRFAKVTLLLFICSIIYDMVVSYSVFKYVPGFFMKYESSEVTKLIFNGNMLVLIVSVALHICAIYGVLIYCRKYRDNIDIKKEKMLMITSNLWVFMLACGAWLHFLGGTTWLV